MTQAGNTPPEPTPSITPPANTGGNTGQPSQADLDTIQVETLFTTCMNAHNLYVEQHFGDVGQYNPSDPLLQLKNFALIQETDSFLEVLLRFWMFYVLVGKAAMFMPETYSIPVTSFQEARHFYPQVTLYFKESRETVEPTFDPIYGEISFRIVKTPVVEINQGWAVSFGMRIKELMGLENFSWSKGWLRVNYQDKAKGYDFRLNVSTKAEGIRIITTVLELQGDVFNESFIVTSQADKSFPAVPPDQFLYGKERRGPRQRPVGTVYFYRASLKLHGVPKDIILYDKTGRSRSALVR